MRNVYKKIIAIALVAAIGSTFGACGKKDKSKDKDKSSSSVSKSADESVSDEDESASDDESISADSVDSEQASAALKQNLTVTLDDQDSQEGAAENNQDATESDGSSGSNSSGNASNGSGSNQYVEVTNDKGEVQTDANGNAETKAVSGNGNGSADGNGGSVSDPNYVSKTTIAKTYWLDMTKSENYVFDGEFLVATFKVKDTTPDGSYPINITKADVANWEAETLAPDLINGYVTVGNAQAPSVDSPTDGNFTISVDSITAKTGDTIEVKFNVSNNPGLVAFVFNFSFDSNALEYQGLSVGKDAEDIITLSE